MKPIQIGMETISALHCPFIVAEMSGNHNQSLEKALALVDAAALCGVHALKIQTYTASTMTIPSKEKGFVISDPKSLWNGYSLYELYEKAHTPWEWHHAIFERCKQKGILGFSSPFDESAVDFLEGLKVPFYKVASFESTDLKLLRKIAATGKPVVISLGMATLAEIEESVATLRKGGTEEIILLKCTSTYPASPKNSNLATIPILRQLFQCQVGISDHTLGLGVSIASVALGATFIERHFTLDRKEGGVDSAFSLEPAEMKMLVEETGRAWEAMGTVQFGPQGPEKESLRFKRSLYVVKDLRAGDTLDPENLRAIRPGFGLPVKHYESLMGKKVNQDVSQGTPASWDLIG